MIPSKKYKLKKGGKHVSFLGAFSIAAGAAMVVFAYANLAQASTQPAAQQADSRNVSRLPAYCKRSTFTGSAFIRLLKTIIEHGNLTDSGYVERTLDTKFTMRHNNGQDGNPDPKSFIYETEEVFGNPIHVELYTSNSPSDQLRIGDIAFMRIESASSTNFIKDCLHVSASDLRKNFGGKFLLGVPTAGAPIPGHDSGNNSSRFTSPYWLDETQVQGSSGMKGSRIFLSFSYLSNDDRVFELAIDQDP